MEVGLERIEERMEEREKNEGSLERKEKKGLILMDGTMQGLTKNGWMA
jgi:hypothetical protein